MEWILEKLPVLVFVVVAIAQIFRAVMKSRDAQAEHREEFDETEEQRRVREIQERIRRMAAERGGAPPPLRPQEEGSPPPDPRPPQPAESFGETLRRGLAGEERRPPPVFVESKSAELERQSGLAEQMRQLAEARELAQRRAARTAASTEATAQSEVGMLRRSRTRLDEDLRDPENLRRAFVLREILGPPVGLR